MGRSCVHRLYACGHRGLAMYRCCLCGSYFSEPDTERVCWEDYYGVGSMFPNSNYGTIEVCPCCGHDEFDSFCEEEDKEFEEWTD